MLFYDVTGRKLGAPPSEPVSIDGLGECRITMDKSELERSQVVVFQAAGGDFPDTPRPETAIWAYFTMESPAKHLFQDPSRLVALNESINYLISYDRRSDIYFPSGMLRQDPGRRQRTSSRSHSPGPSTTSRN